MEFIQEDLDEQEGRYPCAFRLQDFRFPVGFVINMKDLKLTTRIHETTKWYEGLVGACLDTSYQELNTHEKITVARAHRNVKLTLEECMLPTRKCPPLPTNFSSLLAFVTRVQMLWAHLFGPDHPALTLHINRLHEHLQKDRPGYRYQHGWARKKAGTIVFYLKLIEQAYLSRYLQAKDFQQRPIPWPTMEPIVTDIPFLLTADPLRDYWDRPPILKETSTSIIQGNQSEASHQAGLDMNEHNAFDGDTSEVAIAGITKEVTEEDRPMTHTAGDHNKSARNKSYKKKPARRTSSSKRSRFH